MALVPYELTVEDALRLAGLTPSPSGDVTVLAGDEAPAADDARPFLGAHNLRRDLVGVMCWGCEQMISLELAISPCPSPAARASADGNLSPYRTLAPIGRNAPCPCGSGKKFKRCHGAPRG